MSELNICKSHPTVHFPTERNFYELLEAVMIWSSVVAPLGPVPVELESPWNFLKSFFRDNRATIGEKRSRATGKRWCVRGSNR